MTAKDTATFTVVLKDQFNNDMVVEATDVRWVLRKDNVVVPGSLEDGSATKHLKLMHQVTIQYKLH